MLTIDELLKEAFTAFKQGQQAAALALYQQALASDPANFTACYMSGAILLQAEKAAEAEVFLQKAVLVKPDAAEAHNNLGLALARLGRLAPAIVSFRDALRINPRYTNALLN